MARSNKRPWEGKLLTGVSARKLKDGTYVFDITDGTGKPQIRKTTADWQLANAYKTYCRIQRRKGNPRLALEEWVELSWEPVTDDVVRLRPLVREAAEQIGEQLNVSGHVRVILRFLESQGVGATRMADIDARTADAFPRWLSEERYARSTAGGF